MADAAQDASQRFTVDDLYQGGIMEGDGVEGEREGAMELGKKWTVGRRVEGDVRCTVRVPGRDYYRYDAAVLASHLESHRPARFGQELSYCPKDVVSVSLTGSLDGSGLGCRAVRLGHGFHLGRVTFGDDHGRLRGSWAFRGRPNMSGTDERS
jgi:hypothetical protein